MFYCNFYNWVKVSAPINKRRVEDEPLEQRVIHLLDLVISHACNLSFVNDIIHLWLRNYAEFWWSLCSSMSDRTTNRVLANGKWMTRRKNNKSSTNLKWLLVIADQLMDRIWKVWVITCLHGWETITSSNYSYTLGLVINLLESSIFFGLRIFFNTLKLTCTLEHIQSMSMRIELVIFGNEDEYHLSFSNSSHVDSLSDVYMSRMNMYLKLQSF